MILRYMPPMLGDAHARPAALLTTEGADAAIILTDRRYTRMARGDATATINL